MASGAARNKTLEQKRFLYSRMTVATGDRRLI